MPVLLKLPTHADNRGKLTVIEKEIPFHIKRIFYIYGVDNSERGGHRHHKTIQAISCLKGSCTIYVHNGEDDQIFKLNEPNQLLILHPHDWHTMYNFTTDTVLLVIASEYYSANDYIFEPYK